MYLFILYLVTTFNFSVLSAATSNQHTTTHSSYYTHTTKPTALLRANLYLFLCLYFQPSLYLYLCLYLALSVFLTISLISIYIFIPHFLYLSHLSISVYLSVYLSSFCLLVCGLSECQGGLQNRLVHFVRVFYFVHKRNAHIATNRPGARSTPQDVFCYLFIQYYFLLFHTLGHHKLITSTPNSGPFGLRGQKKTFLGKASSKLCNCIY